MNMMNFKFHTPAEKIDAYVPNIPKKVAGIITRNIMRLSTLACPAKYYYGFDKKKMKGRQVLIISRHTSRDDPYYVNAGYNFILPNAIMSRHNVFIPVMYRLLLADGVILKSLYEPDMGAMRNIFRLRKKGASFLLFPEGIQSMDGTTQPIHPATARLIKKLDLDTVLCTNNGAYLCNPRFDTKKRKGKLEYRFDILFSKEEIREMSEDVLYERLLEKFVYNDFAWNGKNQFHYKGKTPCAHGLDNILYICPHCGNQFTMHVENDRLICTCGSSVRIDDCYNLFPDDTENFPFKRIDEWYHWQRGIIEDEIKHDDFSLQYEAEYLTLNRGNLFKGRCQKLGEGKIELGREHLRYIGTDCGKDAIITFDISQLPSTTLSKDLKTIIYHDGIYYQFNLKAAPCHAVKLMTAVELLHEERDPERKKARMDVDKRLEPQD